MAIILSRPDDGVEMNLHPVELVQTRIDALFKVRHTHVNAIADVVVSTFALLGTFYGTSYLALLPVDPRGFVALPPHVRAVSAVRRGPACDPYSHGQRSPENWYPGLGVRGRQWTADQLGSYHLWRRQDFGDLSGYAGARGADVGYQRVDGGLLVPELRHEAGSFPPTVAVSYQAYVTDERGYRLLTEQDAEAAAHQWNYERWQADYFAGNMAAERPMQTAWKLADLHIGRARTGEGLSDNALSRILALANSFDRPDYETGLHLPESGDRSGGAYTVADRYSNYQ